jgi:hypothetical protein
MRALVCGLVLAGAVASLADARQPAAWVTIKGRVVLPPDAPIPARKAVAVPAGVPVCPNVPVLEEKVIVNPKNRGIKNVVVWLRPDDARNAKATFAANEIHPADAKRKPQTVTIDQPCCLFEPHVLACRVGDTLVVKNGATIAHNFFWASTSNGEFNANIQPKGQFTLPKPLASESSPVQYKCTTHPWMSGYVRVFDHPYYAVTDEDGNFEIKDAPAGKFRLVYWHENVGFKGKAPGRFGEPIAIKGDAKGVSELPATPFDVR